MPLVLKETTRAAINEAVGEAVHWPPLQAHVPVIDLMEQTDQDPDYHPEGNVLVHSQLVCSALTAQSPPPGQLLMWAGALHDAGKAVTTREVDGKLTSPHHAEAGSRIARGLLWRLGWNAREREQVSRYIRWHMRPAFIAQSLDARAAALVACDLAVAGATWRGLLALAHADLAGRGNAPVPAQLLERLQLLEMWLEEQGMLDGPYPFASAESRMRSLAGSWQPLVAAPDPDAAQLTLLCGLPATGKSTLAQALGGQVVSLDDIRTRMPGSGTQLTGRVRQQAQLEIRSGLAGGKHVIVDATLLTRQSRQPWVRLGRDYGAWIRIVCTEGSAHEVVSRNKARTGRARVPEEVIIKMLENWQMPSADEAHEMEIRT